MRTNGYTRGSVMVLLPTLRRLSGWVLVAALLAACGELHVPRDDQIVGTRPVHWRIVWTASPQTHAIVSWSTRQPGSSHRVHLDTKSHDGEIARYARSVEATWNGAFTDEGSGTARSLQYHHASLDGLSPSTTYWFVCESDGVAGPELHFTTAPADDRSFAIVSGSDSRSDRAQRRKMNERIAEIAAADPTVLAMTHGGDYVYSGYHLEQFTHWLTDHELTITGDGRVLPIIPTRGNHEIGGKLFDEVFASPGGGLGRNWFATPLSPQVLLLTLNTEVAAGGDQARFVESTLASNAKVRWKVAQYHRPVYPSVKTPAAAKEHWVPLFDAHRLDLAIESDGHTLKRTMPIRGDAPAEGGVVYIGEGGLGVRQRTPDDDRWFLQPPGMAKSAFHVWKIAFHTDRIGLEAIGGDGAVLDTAMIEPKKR